MSARPISSAATDLSWLIRLRWWALGSQLAVFALVPLLLSVALPFAGLLGITLVGLASNLWLSARPTASVAGVALVLAADIALFSALLYLTGGPYNPFSFVYLVHIALGAVVLPARAAWALAALALFFFGLLFGFHRPLDGLLHTEIGPLHLHLYGMWVAAAVAAAFLVYFIQRLNRQIAAREHALRAAEHRAEQKAKVLALTTLAAGAAHELATPLSTIAVVAGDLSRPDLIAKRGAVEIADDARTIRGEVDRCRRILEQLRAGVGGTTGEGWHKVDPEALVTAIRARARRPETVDAAFVPAAPPSPLVLPLTAVAQCAGALVRNAEDAAPDGTVHIRLLQTAESLEITVADDGPGMPPEVLARATEPFFTTKPASAGSGLGLFLSKTVAESLGGTLHLLSEPGRGTTATVSLPLRPPHEEPDHEDLDRR